MERVVKSAEASTIDNEAFDAPADATPLQIERAKAYALSQRLKRSSDEKGKLKALLEKTQHDLELQLKTTLRLQKQQAKQAKADAKAAKQPPAASDDTRALKLELASAQKDLAGEVHASQQREARIQRLEDQCRGYKERLDALKKQRGGEDENQDHQKLIMNLEHQRRELVAVVKKQMRLIDILQQKQAHLESDVVLTLSEKDFRKAVKS